MDSTDKMFFWIIITAIGMIILAIVTNSILANILEYKVNVLLIQTGSKTLEQVIKDITDIFKH